MATIVTLARPSGRKAQATYEALVQQTRAVISEAGGFSAEAVAERAGMSPATFYTYFPSKDDALAAALNDVLDELVARALGELTVEGLLDHGLRAVVERAVGVCVDVFTTGALVMRLALARLPESAAIRHVYREHEHAAIERMKRFIQLGTAAGRLSVRDDEAATTALLVATQALNNPLLLKTDARARTVEMIVGMIVHLLDPEHVSA